MDYNLNAMNLKELKELRSQVDRAIASFEDRRKKAALAELEERARELGVSFAEILKLASGKAKGSQGAAKYANPANPAETWTGRGRKPNWFTAALAAGRKPEDMAV